MEATQIDPSNHKTQAWKRSRVVLGWALGIYAAVVAVGAVLMLGFGIACYVMGGTITPGADTAPIVRAGVSGFRQMVLFSVLLTVLACLMARNCLLGLPMILAAVLGTVGLAVVTRTVSVAGGFLPGWNVAGGGIARFYLGVSSLWVAALALGIAGMFLSWVGFHLHQGYYNLKLKWSRRKR